MKINLVTLFFPTQKQFYVAKNISALNTWKKVICKIIKAQSFLGK